jgi:hypothetical protein
VGVWRVGCAVCEVVDVVGAGLVARASYVCRGIRVCLRAEVRVDSGRREWDGKEVNEVIARGGRV